MIIRSIFLLLFYFGITSCAQLPMIHSNHPDGHLPHAESESCCLNIFPQGRWQLYHTIEAIVPGNAHSRLTGVSVLDSRDRTLQWALMTLEGFVLFSGRFDGTLQIDRAVAPFDKKEFAQGVLEDLRLIFLKPLGIQDVGYSDEGELVCRHSNNEGTTDIVVKADHKWLVRHYSTGNRLSRTIQGDQMIHIGASVIPKHLILKNHALIGYQLDMQLVDAIPMN